VEDVGGFFVGEQRGEGEAGVIVDGGMEGLDAGPGIAHGAIAGGAHARACEAAQLLDVEVEEIAGSVAFVAQRRRFWRLQGRESVEPMAAEHAGEGGFGHGQDHADLGIGTARAAQLEDLGFEGGRGLEGLLMRRRRAVGQALREALRFGSLHPAADSLFADPEGGGGGPERAAVGGEVRDHFGSRQWGQSGISVHVVRAEFGWGLS